jgi:hypothetical protein
MKQFYIRFEDLLATKCNEILSGYQSRQCKEKLEKIQELSLLPVILPVVLFGCETWSFTVREEHRFKLPQKRLLRRIFGPKREEVAGDWRRMRIEELHNLNASTNIVRVTKSRMMRLVGHVACMVEMRNAYNVFVGKLYGRIISE